MMEGNRRYEAVPEEEPVWEEATLEAGVKEHRLNHTMMEEEGMLRCRMEEQRPEEATMVDQPLPAEGLADDQRLEEEPAGAAPGRTKKEPCLLVDTDRHVEPRYAIGRRRGSRPITEDKHTEGQRDGIEQADKDELAPQCGTSLCVIYINQLYVSLSDRV